MSSGFLEEEEEEFRKVYIPGTSGDYIEAPMDVSDEDALIWARDNVLEAEETLAPLTFAAPIEGQMLTPRAEEEDSGPIDAFLGSASRAFQGLRCCARGPKPGAQSRDSEASVMASNHGLHLCALCIAHPPAP